MDDTTHSADALQRTIDRLTRRMTRLQTMNRRYGWGRLIFVLVIAGLAFSAFQWIGSGAGWLVVIGGIALFFVIAHYHDRVETSLTRHRLARHLKRQHVARLHLDWAQLSTPLSIPPEASHLFATDLNLVGARSLHHLLDTTASLGGSCRLRNMLLDLPTDRARIHRRQRLVRALVPLAPFRDRLTLLSLETGDDPDTRWDDASLRTWLEREQVTTALKPWLVGLTGFALVNLGLIVGHVLGALPPLWPFVITVYYAVYALQYRNWAHLFDEARDLERQLERFAPALRYLERYRFPSGSPLVDHCAPLQAENRRPSRHLKRIGRIAAAASYTENEGLWVLLNTLLPWELLLTYLLHRVKRDVRTRLPEWLDVWYDLEALGALASYAEHYPARAFPDVIDEAPDAPAFAASALGHPLLPEEDKVRNNFRMAELGAVVLVTGSNMSGKSTFLRTVGVNLVLAFAGGPVDAATLSTRVFRPFTCMNVSDSVQDGLSYFYAEVQRLKALRDALQRESAPPLFFLIDEIFRGTNNRERLLGSRAYVHALAGAHGVGLISTHDLELVHLADAIPALRNVHFREEISDGRMTFDYTLRPGPCPTTNALTIMQQVGLPVDVPPSSPPPSEPSTSSSPNHNA